MEIETIQKLKSNLLAFKEGSVTVDQNRKDIEVAAELCDYFAKVKGDMINVAMPLERWKDYSAAFITGNKEALWNVFIKQFNQLKHEENKTKT